MNEIYNYVINNIVNKNVLATKCMKDSKVYLYITNNVVNKNVLRTISTNNEEGNNIVGTALVGQAVAG